MANLQDIGERVLSIAKYIYFLPIEGFYSKLFAMILLIHGMLKLKKILILFVRIYQLAAPTMVRNSCLYTPCCSEYMILSIEKYGCVKGVIKGIKRICRCHIPNGGIDYP